MQNANVLFVFADQWTFWALGANGNTDVRTPNLDRFATESVNCTHAVSSTPVCTPARGSLLTALRPDKHGLFINDVPLDPELPSFGKHFREAGYATAYAGKWHVDGHGRYQYIPPDRRHGFDYFKALECTHDYLHSRYYAGDDPSQRLWLGYDAFAQTDDLIHWLHHRPDDHQPFCAVLAWGPPHNPYHTAPEAYRENYHAETLSVRRNVPESLHQKAAETLAGYYAHCEALDSAWGRLMKAIDALGCRDNTVVVFTSDHGDMLFSHGLTEKQGPWEESLRIPFLIRAPWVLRAGTENSTFIEFQDCWPTIAGLCDLPLTAPVQGRDLSSWLISGSVPGDNTAFYASYVPFGTWANQKRATELTQAREARGLRTAQHLYVEDLSGPWLLYDCVEDPFQLRNRVGDPEWASVQEDLARQLRKRLDQDGDEFLPGEEYIARWKYATGEKNTMPITEWSG